MCFFAFMYRSFHSTDILFCHHLNLGRDTMYLIFKIGFTNSSGISMFCWFFCVCLFVKKKKKLKSGILVCSATFLVFAEYFQLKRTQLCRGAVIRYVLTYVDVALKKQILYVQIQFLTCDWEEMVLSFTWWGS